MLDTAHRELLHRIARQSIAYGLQHDTPLRPELSDYDDPVLTEKRATFVTLMLHGDLRGCIGTLQAVRPLIDDVAYNAFSAAFGDPRFSPVSEDEAELLSIHISILMPAEEMHFDSEQDLIRQIRKGVDGIILEENNLRATFLPSVWETIHDKQEFLNHLKMKAGLRSNYWSDSIRIKRYEVESF